MVSGHSPSCPLMAIVSSVVESSIEGNDNIDSLKPVSNTIGSLAQQGTTYSLSGDTGD